MSSFRIIATCFDGAGAPIPLTWYGNATSPSDAIFQMTLEARGSGLSIGVVICVQQRLARQGKEVAA